MKVTNKEYRSPVTHYSCETFRLEDKGSLGGHCLKNSDILDLFPKSRVSEIADLLSF